MLERMTRRKFLQGTATLWFGSAIAWWASMALEVADANFIPFSATWSWSVNLGKLKPSFLAPCLDAVSILGAELVRFDADWRDLEPEEGSWSSAQLQWYHTLMEGVRQKGLKAIANLDGYPPWALRELSSHPDRFFNHWHRAVHRMASILGPEVAYYQLGNEFNTILDPIPAKYDGNVMRIARQALDEVFSEHPSWTARTVINPFFGFNHFGSEWDGALRQVLDEAADAIDVLALDYYPGSYTPFVRPSDWSPLANLAQYANEYQKELAVGELGYPTFPWGENRQAAWLKITLDALNREVDRLKIRKRFAFVNIFELMDRSHLDWWELWRPTETSLGIIDTHFRPKRGYWVLREIIDRSKP